MKKWGSFILVLCLVVTAAACSSKTTTDQAAGSSGSAKTEPPQSAAPATKAPPAEAPIKGTITMATHRTDIVDTKFPEWAKKFQEKYPDVQVKFEAYADYAKDLKVRMASNDFADIALNPGIAKADLPQYFATLDDLGLNDQILFKDLMTYNGKLYGITSGVVPFVVSYNKRVFEKAGITAVPKTWDEFLAACEKLKNAGVLPIATNFKDAWPLQVWLFASGVFDNDPNFLNSWAKSNTPWKSDGSMGKSVALFKQLMDKGYVDKDLTSTNWMQTFPDMANGKIGMAWLGSYMVANYINIGKGKPEDFGIFTMPLDNSGTNSVVLSPDMTYVINKNSKNLPAAKAFLKFLLLESGYNDFAGLMSPIKGHPNADKDLQVLLDTKPKMFELAGAEDDYTNIINKSQIDIWKMMQEYMLAKDPKDTMDKYNKKWADARSALGIK